MERQAFREAVFARDGGLCVFCKATAVDAHHLLERRLWADGGYHLDNGISVCADCHIACEQTIYSVEDGRTAAKIETVLVPDHMYADVVYDKWGNVVLDDGHRTIGELFYDESVQKALKDGGVLDCFVSYVKYPRTYHLPWSHPNKDDRTMSQLDVMNAFVGKHVVVTEKMDGECTTLYNDKIHARAIDGRAHPSQGWVRNFWSQIAHDIPQGWRVCGENLYARHSIHYEDLPTYFMGFSLWDGVYCLSWKDTLEWFTLLGIEPVPVLYEGKWDKTAIDRITNALDLDRQEGYVVRIADGFTYREFRRCVAKYVRPQHLQTPERWDRAVIPNGLKRGTQ